MDLKRMWATTETGMKWHAFEGTSARCRKNIRPRMYAIVRDDFRTLAQVQELFTDADICTTCLAAVRTEQQAEFDAEAAPACICPVRTDYHTIACQTFQAAHSSTDIKEDTVALKDGSITPRQARIIELASAGMRQNEIAKKLGVSYPVIRMEVTAIVQKFKADSSGQVYAMHARAEAYLAAAQLLEDQRPENPEGETDVHVYHVLNGLALILRERAAALLPK